MFHAIGGDHCGGVGLICEAWCRYLVGLLPRALFKANKQTMPPAAFDKRFCHGKPGRPKPCCDEGVVLGRRVVGAWITLLVVRGVVDGRGATVPPSWSPPSVLVVVVPPVSRHITYPKSWEDGLFSTKHTSGSMVPSRSRPTRAPCSKHCLSRT